jgi:nicotinamide-nucleotide amidase
MAKNIRKKFGTDYAMATSGIAGPTGAVKGKPVGTVFIALAAKNKLVVGRYQFKGSRNQVISQSAHKTLEILWANL